MNSEPQVVKPPSKFEIKRACMMRKSDVPKSDLKVKVSGGVSEPQANDEPSKEEAVASNPLKQAALLRQLR